MKNKIVHFGLSQNFGGIESYVQNMYECIDKKSFLFEFINVSDQGIANEKFLASLGATFWDITPRSRSYIRHVFDLLKFFRQQPRGTIFEFHLMSYSWFEPILIARIFAERGQIILHGHATSESGISFRARLLSRIGKILVRPNERRFILTACGSEAGEAFFGRNNFLVLANGISLERFSYNERYRVRIRKTMGLRHEHTLIMHVGRFSLQKNHTKLLDIFRSYLEINPHAVLALIGDGELRAAIETKIDEMGMGDSVRLLGRRNDMDALYNAADIIVMPSLYEGIPVSIIEAQANGLECLVSGTISKEVDVSGNVVYIRLSAPSSEWAAALAGRRFTRDAMASKKLKDTNYNIRNTVKRLESMYNELIDKGYKS